MNLKSVIHNIGSFTNEAIVISDVDPDDGATLVIRWVNPAFTLMTQYPPDEVLGRSLGLLAGDETDPVTHADVIDLLSRWRSFTVKIVCARKDGESFWSEMSFQPVGDTVAGYRFWICTIRDVSVQVKAQEAQRDLAMIAQATQDMVMILDQWRRVSWVNLSYMRHTGRTLADVRGVGLRDLIAAPDTDAATFDAMEARLDRNEPAFGKVLTRRKDGTLYLGEYEILPIFDAHGRPRHHVSLHRDITEFASLERRYEGIINQAGFLTLVKQGGRYVMVNAAMAALFGKPVAWFQGKTDDDLLGPGNGPFLGIDEDALCECDGAVARDRDVACPDGVTRTFLVRAFRIHEPTLDAYLICCTATDVTALKETEQGLRRAQSEAQAAQHRMLAAIDAMPDGFVLYDSDDRIVLCNQAFRRLHGAIAETIRPGLCHADLLRIGLAAGLWVAEDGNADDWIAQRIAARQRALGSEAETEVGFADGRWMLSRETLLSNGEKVGIWIDVTDIKNSAAALRDAQEGAEMAHLRLTAAVDSLGDAFVICDSDDRVVVFNEYAINNPRTVGERLRRGEKYEDLLRRMVEGGRFADANGREEEWIAWRLDHHRNPRGPFEVTYNDGRVFRVIERKTARGDTVTLRIEITNEVEQGRQLKSYAEDLRRSRDLANLRNRELEATRARVEHASLHDALTGLANRRYLDRTLPEMAESCLRNGKVCGVLHIDLDRFKQINDTMGHDAGDFVLVEVARILRDCCRPGDFAARVGGDEFVILTAAASGCDDLSELAERIVGRMRQPLRYRNQDIHFGTSIGIAVKHGPEPEVRQLLINADIALYRAKQLGRNRWESFSKALQSEVVATKQIADEIVRAIDRDEFHAFYQPQFDAKTWELLGVEALVRWFHPTRGALAPQEFLKVAGEMNLVRTIDQIMLRRVVEDRAMWSDAGLHIPKVSVNISGRRLREPELIDDIRAGGFAPGSLTIELLESIFLDDDDAVIAWTIDQMREMGISIELDDFGTGHSSIVGLIKLRPSGLKIDRQFVAPITEAAEQAALVRSIIEIGHSLGVHVVAEGVETIAHAHILRDLGCDILQGYAFARPMPAADLISFVAARAWQDTG